MKGKKTGGRQKGSLNKRTTQVEEIAAKFELDPFEVLMMIATEDWEGLGYDARTYTVYGKDFTNEVYHVPLSDRKDAAKEASKYLYAQKKSVELTTEQDGFKIVVEDYSKK